MVPHVTRTLKNLKPKKQIANASTHESKNCRTIFVGNWIKGATGILNVAPCLSSLIPVLNVSVNHGPQNLSLCERVSPKAPRTLLPWDGKFMALPFWMTHTRIILFRLESRIADSQMNLQYRFLETQMNILLFRRDVANAKATRQHWCATAVFPCLGLAVSVSSQPRGLRAWETWNDLDLFSHVFLQCWTMLNVFEHFVQTIRSVCHS